MKRNHDRLSSMRSRSERSRGLLAAAIGLCFAMGSADAGLVPQPRPLTAQPEQGAVVLTWTPPPTLKASRLVIRFEVDGPAPSSPAGGSALFDAATAPGAAQQTLHAFISPEHAYAYSAFALDESGVVVAAVTAVATPLPLEAPATVRNLRRVDVRSASGNASNSPNRP